LLLVGFVAKHRFVLAACSINSNAHALVNKSVNC
jgi:hypothetical protein